MLLRELRDTDEAAFLAAADAWRGEDLSWHTFDWKPGMAFTDLVAKLRDNAVGRALEPGHVASTMLYGFDGATIVGRVNIRHALTDSLLRRGGHIGYAVAPAFRRKGYATEMVNQALPVCRALGLDRLLVTCGEDNVASRRIIENIGGTLEDTAYDDVDDEVICRYWVVL